MNLGVLQVMSCGEHFAGLWVIQWTGGCSLQEHWPVGQLSGSLQPQLTFGDLLSLCYPRRAEVWAYKRSHTAFPQATVMGMGWNKMTLERGKDFWKVLERGKCQSRGEGKVRSWYSHLTLADQNFRVTKWHGQRWLLHVGSGHSFTAVMPSMDQIAHSELREHPSNHCLVE